VPPKKSSSSPVRPNLDNKTETKIQPHETFNQSPSKNFMNFCDNVIKNSKKDETEHEYKPEYQRQLDQHRQDHEQSLNSNQQQVNMKLDTSYPLHNFIVVTLDYVNDEPATQVLQRSAGFCKMSTSWEYKGSNICFVMVDGQVVCESTGLSKNDARDKATAKAVNILQKHCYTIQVKNQYASDGTQVDLMDVEVNTSVGGKAAKLQDNNIGHKLLSLMGWSGGGLGKEGAGISEPVTATTVFGREGLGNRQVRQNFKQKITKIVEEWVNSNSPYDLVFTTGFDNDQRKEMHTIARRLGLKSKSFGKGDDRHLTISRKFNPVSLIEELLRRGGETERFKLLPPSNL